MKNLEQEYFLISLSTVFHPDPGIWSGFNYDEILRCNGNRPDINQIKIYINRLKSNIDQKLFRLKSKLKEMNGFFDIRINCLINEIDFITENENAINS